MEGTPSQLDLLSRFVCVGSEDGTYTVTTQKNKQQSHSKRKSTSTILFSAETEKPEVLSPFLASTEESLRALDKLRKVFKRKWYISKDPLLSSLARIVRSSVPSNEKNHENDAVRDQAYKLALQVCETSKDLFTFVNLDKFYGKPKVDGKCKVGWGRGLRTMITEFYESKPALKLAREVMHCKQALGFTHRDLIRQCHLHPSKKGRGRAEVMNYLVKDQQLVDSKMEMDEEAQAVMTFLQDVHQLKGNFGDNKDKVRVLVEKHGLTSQQVPPNCLQFKEMLNEDSPHVRRVTDRLTSADEAELQQLSPALVLKVEKKYSASKKKWKKNQDVVNALQRVYQDSLRATPKLLLGKKCLLALNFDPRHKDVRVDGFTELKVIHVCALVTEIMLRTTDSLQVVHLTDEVEAVPVTSLMNHRKVTETLNKAATKNKVLEAQRHYGLEGCMSWASGKRFDNILIVCEKKSKAPHGPSPVHTAIAEFRRNGNADTKIAIVGLADTAKMGMANDLNLLDVSGFDETVPVLLQKFFQGYSDD
ncbi:60 kDa SS-A/Ro ribonucleoprotein isoform X2 [Aplysia californica]|uniref:60 kDa SS-A/Ro ribonucleoprotein isoform X2 n=1 Tax=Aplysia californica TaxID=6500 RepID=A0ABM0JZ58_APLCA|nr:60 kDa SS-A/Ro ribonucleoprotein isoform X2 [Aplysia californica]